MKKLLLSGLTLLVLTVLQCRVEQRVNRLESSIHQQTTEKEKVPMPTGLLEVTVTKQRQTEETTRDFSGHPDP